MKLSTVVAAAGGTLFVAAGAHAGFNGIQWLEVDNQGYADRTVDVGSSS